jgi:hypothetical protein
MGKKDDEKNGKGETEWNEKSEIKIQFNLIKCAYL